MCILNSFVPFNSIHITSMVRKTSFGFLYLLVICILILHEVDGKRKNTKRKSDSNNKNLAQKTEISDKTLGETKNGTDGQQNPSLMVQPKSEEFKSKNFRSNSKDKNNSYCAMSEVRKAIRLEGIKNQILNELGLSRPPNITGKHLPPASIIADLFDKDETQFEEFNDSLLMTEMEDKDEDELVSTREKVLCFEQPHLPVKQAKEGDRTLYFKVSRNLLIHSADLYFYFKSNLLLPEFNITLYRISRRNSLDHPELKQVGRQLVENRTTQGFWIKFDVKRSLLHLFRHSKDDAGFVIRNSSPQHPNLVINKVEDDNETTKPFIAIEVKKQNHRRNKRMLGLSCEKDSKEKRCCKHPFIVNFEILGWDWILAPRQYEANFCNGECPYAFLLKNYHTHVIQQSNPQGFVGPCCAPSKMSSMSILYYTDEHNIRQRRMPGMVVESCGCS